MALLSSHAYGRYLPTPCHYSYSLRKTVSRVSSCRVRQRRLGVGYATIAAEDVTPAAAASSSQNHKRPPPLKNPFPYPTNPKPTPHQIFHLPVNATQAQIKARYYELVHAHHPDSQYTSHLPWDTAQHRFRSIKASYDYLTGRSASPDPNARPAPTPKHFDPYTHEMARRRRAYYASQASSAEWGDADGVGGGGGGGNGKKTAWEGFGAPMSERSEWDGEGWRERMVLALGVVTLLAGLFPTMPMTLANAFIPTSTSSSYLQDSAASSSYSTNPSSPNHDHNHTNNSASSSSGGFVFPFSLDFDKRHREAVSALVQARCDREEMGVERREGLRKRVQEMRGGDGETAEGECGPNDHDPSDAEGGGITASASVSAVEMEEGVARSPEAHVHDEDLNSSSDAVSPR